VRQIIQMTRVVAMLFPLVLATSAHADDIVMTLGVSKSTQLSGLLDYILPIFKTASNVKVEVVAVEPGQELALAARAEVDAMLLDDRAAAEKIVAGQHGVNRLDAVYDDFVIVGPSSDPAGIRGFTDAGKAFAQIAAKGAPFASRGDGSTANRLELQLWKSAGVEPGGGVAWYSKSGQGMEPTLSLAAAKNAYTLTDRATWANSKDRKSLEILTQGDPACFHVYSTILGDPIKRPLNKFTYARIWHDWIVNHHGREAIEKYRINGEQIFFQSPRPAADVAEKSGEKKKSAVP
jgi:tungstate transport system substrate-binding protein